MKLSKEILNKIVKRKKSLMSCKHIFIYYNKNGNRVKSELGMRKNPVPFCVLCRKIIFICCDSSYQNICKNNHPECNIYDPSICKHFKIKRSLCEKCGILIKECSVMTNQKSYTHAVIKNREKGGNYCRRCSIKTCIQCGCIANSSCWTCEENAYYESHYLCDCGSNGAKLEFLEQYQTSICMNCYCEIIPNPDEKKYSHFCKYCRNTRSFYEIKTWPICPQCGLEGGHVRKTEMDILSENWRDVCEEIEKYYENKYNIIIDHNYDVEEKKEDNIPKPLVFDDNEIKLLLQGVKSKDEKMKIFSKLGLKNK